MSSSINRREFLQGATALSGLAASAFSSAMAQDGAKKSRSKLILLGTSAG